MFPGPEMEGTKVITMDQDCHGGSLFPICNNKYVCVGGGSHNWLFVKMRPILLLGFSIPELPGN